MVGTKAKLILTGIALVASLGIPTYSYLHNDTIITRINGTEVKKDKKTGIDVYLVYTDAGVFKDVDAWYKLKWNSSDVYNAAMRLNGKEAKIKKYGWRIPIMSKYENIVSIKEVTK